MLTVIRILSISSGQIGSNCSHITGWLCSRHLHGSCSKPGTGNKFEQFCPTSALKILPCGLVRKSPSSPPLLKKVHDPQKNGWQSTDAIRCTKCCHFTTLTATKHPSLTSSSTLDIFSQFHLSHLFCKSQSVPGSRGRERSHGCNLIQGLLFQVMTKGLHQTMQQTIRNNPQLPLEPLQVHQFLRADQLIIIY